MFISEDAKVELRTDVSVEALASTEASVRVEVLRMQDRTRTCRVRTVATTKVFLRDPIVGYRFERFEANPSSDAFTKGGSVG